jgi:hypothetical protein
VASRAIFTTGVQQSAVLLYRTTPSNDPVYAQQSGTPDPIAGLTLPALVLSVGGVAPDYLNSQFLVFAPNGQIYLRSGAVSAATWASGGSNPALSRWQLVDALS